MKTGTHPMRTRLRLFLERGIIFGEPYQMPERVARKVAYAGKRQLTQAIIRKKRGTTPPANQDRGQAKVKQSLKKKDKTITELLRLYI